MAITKPTVGASGWNTAVDALIDQANASATTSRVVLSGGDGTTNVTTAFQTQIDAAATAGGGLVMFGAGVHIVAGLVMKTGVHLRGPGHRAATLKLPASANTDVIVSQNFATITGTDDSGSLAPYSFSLAGFSIDGNSADNTSGRGIKLYARDFILRDLRVYSCPSGGVYTEWANVSSLSGVNDAMESVFHNVKSHDNGAWGFDMQGPHDSFMEQCVAYNNTSGGFWFHGNAHGTLARSCHVWGPQPVGLILAQNGVKWELGDVETTGTSGYICALLQANDCTLSGKVWDPGVTAGVIGVKIGDGTHTPYNNRVDVLIEGTPGGGVNFANSGGANWVSGQSYLTTGTLITGSPLASDVIDMPIAQGGVTPAWAGKGGGALVRDWVGVNYSRARQMLPDPAGTPTWYKLGRWVATASGSRMKLELCGTSGYGADQSTVGRTFIVLAQSDSSPSPNIAGYYYAEGGTDALLAVKAVAGAGATGRTWDIWAQVDAYTGNSHITAEVGNDTNPGTWTWALTSGSDPGVASTTVAVLANTATTGYITHSVGHIVGGIHAGYSVVLAAGAGAGTSPTVSAPVTGTDSAGTVQVATGTSPAAGALVSATFAFPYTATPKAVVVTPANAATVGLGLYVSAVSTTAFTVSAASAPAASTTYLFRYAVIG